MTPTVSVVIVHLRGRDRLLRSIEEVARQVEGERGELLLVDNASREGAAGEIRRRFPSVRILPQESNRGFAAGCLAGAEAAASDWLVFFNDDAIPEPGWLGHLREAAGRLPSDVYTVAGRLTDRTGEKIDFNDGFLVFDGHAFADRVGAPAHAGGEPGDERLFACGGNMLVDRREFFQSGGFDPDYFAYLEDVDFGWRQWILGHRVLYEPRAAARHEGGATGEALGLYNRGFLIEKNAWATAYKNFDAEHLRELWGAAATAFLSRIDAMIRRDPGAATLSLDPYREAEGPHRRRLRRWLGVRAPEESVRIDDPLAIAQLRALRAVLAGGDRLAASRVRVQERRVRPDREIFARFPLRIVPTYPGDEIFAAPFFAPFLPDTLPLSSVRLDDVLPGRA